MKRLLNLTLLLAIALATAVPSLAETVVDVSGQVRFRDEADRRTFDTSKTKFNTFSWLRTRVNVKATVDENVTAFVQMQDSRMLGGTDAFGGGQSATLNDGESVDMHQAYIKINNLFGEGWGAMGGRFEFNLGNQRLFGAVGWHNVGRSMEGGALWYDAEKFAITGYDVKAAENDVLAIGGVPTGGNATGNADFDVLGLHVNLKKPQVELFASVDNAAAQLAEATDIGGTPVTAADSLSKAMQRITFGAYTHRTFGSNDLTVNAAMQTGHQMIATGDARYWLKQDIAAIMFTAEFGHNFGDSRNSRAAIGVDYTSGDDGTDVTESKTFNNLFYTGHKFRGYMDYFGAPHAFAAGGAIATAGLMDIMLRAQTDITTGWTIKADVHMFKTAEDYLFDSDTSFVVAMTPTSDLGMEIDITVVTTRVKGVKLIHGFSAFIAKDDFAASRNGGLTDKQTGLWGYSQAVVNF